MAGDEHPGTGSAEGTLDSRVSEAPEQALQVETPKPAPAPEFTEVPRRLAPKLQSAWILAGIFEAVFLTGLAVAAEILWSPAERWIGLNVIPLGTLIFVPFVIRALIWPRFRYRAWSLALRPRVLVLNEGVLFRVQRTIPRARIQHLDIHSGPIARWFGIVEVTIFTAGYGLANARIPGLLPEEAEALRRKLLPVDSHE